jgi:ferredoxin, 2Fe-2S
MPKVTFITHDGEQYDVQAEAGTTLMHAAIDNSVPGIIAECGGACACGTCHCYVDESQIGLLPEPQQDEQDMIECVLDPQDNSRLSCQVVLTDEMDGLKVNLPEAQY